MASFKFNLLKPYDVSNNGERKISTKETRVYLFVIHDRDNVLKIKTEHNVKPVHWDFKEKRVKPQATGSKVINDLLFSFREKIETEYNRIRKDYPNMMFPAIAQNLKIFAKENESPVYTDKNKPFFQVYDEYIEAKMNNVSDLTIKKYYTLKKSLQAFSPKITFNSIDLTFYDKYIHYLQTIKPRGRQKTRPEGDQFGLLNDTTAKYIEGLKNFLKWSYERNYHENDKYKHSDFKAKRKVKNDIVTLFIDELKTLYNHDLSGNSRLEKVRDVFCFGCFTAQRWSDIERFNKKDLKGDTWEFTSYKTKKEITIPFVGYSAPALDIVKKYNYELPKISPQKFNEYLKEIGILAGLNRVVSIEREIGNKTIVIEKPVNEFMSSHMARRSAVSILLNSEKMPIHFVRQITGHSDLKTLDKYLDKDPQALRDTLSDTKSVNTVMEIVRDEPTQNAV